MARMVLKTNVSVNGTDYVEADTANVVLHNLQVEIERIKGEVQRHRDHRVHTALDDDNLYRAVFEQAPPAKLIELKDELQRLDVNHDVDCCVPFESIEGLLIAMLRCNTVRHVACLNLKPEYFRQHERYLAILVDVIKEHQAVYQMAAIPYLDIRGLVTEKLETLRKELKEGLGAIQHELLAVPAGTSTGADTGFLYHAYRGIEPGDFSLEHMLSVLRRFVSERKFSELMKTQQ